MAVCGYAALSSAFYFYFKYKKHYEDVSYWSMYTLPFRLDEHKREMGEYQIEKAKKILKSPDLDQKKFFAAYQNLRAGVLKSPANLEARMMLAEMLIFLLKNQDMGMSVLQQGVQYAYQDFAFLQYYIKILLNFKKDAEVIDLAERILATDPGTEIQKLLALGAATAHQFRGNFDQAEDYVQTYRLDDELEGALLSAQISWERGQKQTAIAKLKASVGRYTNDEAIYARLSRFYRKMGDFEKARAETVKRIVNAPLEIGPKIDLLHILRNIGEAERAERQAEDVFLQYKNDKSSLLKLASYGAEFGLVDLNRRIYQHALASDYDIASFALMLIEANIERKQYDEAIRFTEELVKERPDWLERHWAIFNSLRAVAHFGNGNKDLSNIYLDQFLKETHVRVESLLAVSNAFLELGGQEEARAVLLQAYSNNPENQAALSQLIKLEIQLGNSADLGGYLKRLLKMRRPSIDLLNEAYRKLGSDRFIFTRDRKGLLIELNSILNPIQETPNTSTPS